MPDLLLLLMLIVTCMESQSPVLLTLLLLMFTLMLSTIVAHTTSQLCSRLLLYCRRPLCVAADATERYVVSRLAAHPCCSLLSCFCLDEFETSSKLSLLLRTPAGSDRSTVV